MMDSGGKGVDPAGLSPDALRLMLNDMLLLNGMDPWMGYVRQSNACVAPPDPEFQAGQYLQRPEARTAGSTLGRIPAFLFTALGLVAWLILDRACNPPSLLMIGILPVLIVSLGYLDLLEHRAAKQLLQRLATSFLYQQWLQAVLHDGILEAATKQQRRKICLRATKRLVLPAHPVLRNASWAAVNVALVIMPAIIVLYFIDRLYVICSYLVFLALIHSIRGHVDLSRQVRKYIIAHLHSALVSETTDATKAEIAQPDPLSGQPAS